MRFGFRERGISVCQPMYFHIESSYQTEYRRFELKFCAFCAFLWRLKGDGLFGPELEFAMFVNFGFGLQTVRNFDNVIEYALTNFIDRLSAIDHAAGG